MGNATKLFLIFLGAAIVAFMIHPFFGVVVFALTIFPVPLWGFGADKLDEIDHNKKVSIEIEQRNKREKEIEAAQLELEKELKNSIKVNNLAVAIRTVNFYCPKVTVETTYVYCWSQSNHNLKLYLEDFGIIGLPSYSARPLAIALASTDCLKEVYRYAFSKGGEHGVDEETLVRKQPLSSW